jgi:phage-related protein
MSYGFEKPLFWVASSRKDLSSLPPEVQATFGYALYIEQTGGKHSETKPLKGFGHAGVLEVVEDFQGNTYCAVYTVRFGNAVYVLHCFQKKSMKKSQTPHHDIAVVKSRLLAAESHWKGLTHD